LPTIVALYHDRAARLIEWQKHDPAAEWTETWWFADTTALRAADFDLSAGRHRPRSQTAHEHRNPRELLDELAAIETEITEEVDALRAILAERDA
jgi:type I restriction enzyme M protein